MEADPAEPDVATRISTWRRKRGLTHRQLAELVGVSVAAVYAWESPSYGAEPTLANLVKIVEAFEISLAKFFGPLPKLKIKAAA